MGAILKRFGQMWPYIVAAGTPPVDRVMTVLKATHDGGAASYTSTFPGMWTTLLSSTGR